jgi:hypothetical protein
MTMSMRKRAAKTTPGVRQRALEALLFIAASLVGIYGIGHGLAGFYEAGQPISLVWLAAAGVAVFVLFAQMGRVHDTWIHKPTKRTPGQATDAAATATRATAETDEPPDRHRK